MFIYKTTLARPPKKSDKDLRFGNSKVGNGQILSVTYSKSLDFECVNGSILIKSQPNFI